MGILSRIAKAAYKMTPKRKAALAKAVAASAKARALKTGAKTVAKKGAKVTAKATAKSIGRSAGKPFKAYAGSVSRRTTKRRVTAMAKTSRKLTSAKVSNPRLATSLNSVNIESRIAKGARASAKTNYDRLSTALSSSQANLNAKGGKGALGYLRKRAAKNNLRDLNDARKTLQRTTTRDISTARALQRADRLLALNEKQTIDLSKTYAALSKGNTVGNYAKTVGRDVAAVSAAAVAANEAYRQYEAKKK